MGSTDIISARSSKDLEGIFDALPDSNADFVTTHVQPRHPPSALPISQAVDLVEELSFRLAQALCRNSEAGGPLYRYALDRPHIASGNAATFALLVMNHGIHAAQQTPGVAADSAGVIAINVLLLPDAGMTAAANGLNAQLRAQDATGFRFDNTHVPHISLLHRFVRRADLAKVQSAVAQTISHANPVGWQLRATHLESKPWDGRATMNIAIERTPQLAQLQLALITALAPITVSNGDARAFMRLAKDPPASVATVEHVRTFVPEATDENFKPHITAGVGAPLPIDQMTRAPFTPITFGVADVAIFQLGDLGTARQILWHIAED